MFQMIEKSGRKCSYELLFKWQCKFKEGYEHKTKRGQWSSRKTFLQCVNIWLLTCTGPLVTLVLSSCLLIKTMSFQYCWTAFYYIYIWSFTLAMYFVYNILVYIILCVIIFSGIWTLYDYITFTPILKEHRDGINYRVNNI